MNKSILIEGCSTDEYCPESAPKCEKNKCLPYSGVVLLERIVVTDAPADGTYTLRVFGSNDASPVEDCTTPELRGPGNFTGDANLGERSADGCFKVRRPEL